VDPQYIFVVGAVILMGWFAIGVLFNLRRGDALMKWMQNGLPSIGQRTTFRWLGTSVVELVIAHAKKPFRRLETLLVLKPRDVFWLTIQAYFQGRSDFVIFRAQLTTAPLTDLDLIEPKSFSGRTLLKQFNNQKWDNQEYKGMLLLAPKGLLELAVTTLDKLNSPIEKLSPRYVRLSLRRKEPHLEIHVPFPPYRTTDAGRYFEALRELAVAVGERD
jgi:hypothetical protein